MNNNRLSLTHQTVEADEHHIDEDDEGEGSYVHKAEEAGDDDEEEESNTS